MGEGRGKGEGQEKEKGRGRRKRGGAGEGLRDETPYIVVGHLDFITLHTFESIFDVLTKLSPANSNLHT